jgi:exopolysaccharide biosynthesis protein
MQIRALRVDLREPGVEVLVTPSNGDKPLDCAARTPSEFLAEFKCQAAINGSAFTPLASRPADPQDVRGLSLSRGDLYSKPNSYDALLITRDGKARIARDPIDATNAYNGLSGFYALLIDGKNNGTDRNIHPRSAVGVSRDGHRLILMTIDGRQIGYSEGATTSETAEWIRKLGAHDALNLDGGGSTALVIEGPEGKPVVLNRPSGKYERRVANHLGIYARPLPGSGEDAP